MWFYLTMQFNRLSLSLAQLASNVKYNLITEVVVVNNDIQLRGRNGGEHTFEVYQTITARYDQYFILHKV